MYVVDSKEHRYIVDVYTLSGHVMNRIYATVLRSVTRTHFVTSRLFALSVGMELNGMAGCVITFVLGSIFRHKRACQPSTVHF